MEIFIYGGLKSTPSIDFNCLRTLALIKSFNAPVKVNYNGNPFYSPNGKLPYLKTRNGETIAGYARIARHLYQQGFCASIDSNLSDAHVSFLTEHLYGILQYYLWGDPQNTEVTRLLYAKRIPVPSNLYYPATYVQTTKQLMLTLEIFSIDDKLDNHQTHTNTMLLNALCCLNMLEKRLSGNDFAVFDSPTEFGSTLFAYLAIINNVLPHSHVLRNHVNECPHLLQFEHTYHQKYFAYDDDLLSEKNNSHAIRAEDKNWNGSAKSDLDEEHNSSKWLPTFLAVLIAGGAMFLFGMKKGIIICDQ